MLLIIPLHIKLFALIPSGKKALFSTPGHRVSDTVGLADCLLTSGVIPVYGKQATRGIC